MATPKGYTTEEKIEEYMLKDINADFSEVIDGWIAGVEATIDLLTGRNFIADDTATTRLFDGDDTDKLLIDDCTAITKVEVGNDNYGSSFREISASGASRYFTEPANHSSKGFPITSIKLNADQFLQGTQNQRITAKWGYSDEVPADIERAATIFVAGIINQQTPGGDQVKSKRIGNYSVTYNTENGRNSFADFEQAMTLLEQYKKYRI